MQKLVDVVELHCGIALQVMAQQLSDELHGGAPIDAPSP
jgi:hypothetical protein